VYGLQSILTFFIVVSPFASEIDATIGLLKVSRIYFTGKRREIIGLMKKVRIDRKLLNSMAASRQKHRLH